MDYECCIIGLDMNSVQNSNGIFFLMTSFFKVLTALTSYFHGSPKNSSCQTKFTGQDS